MAATPWFCSCGGVRESIVTYSTPWSGVTPPRRAYAEDLRCNRCGSILRVTISALRNAARENVIVLPAADWTLVIVTSEDDPLLEPLLRNPV